MHHATSAALAAALLLTGAANAAAQKTPALPRVAIEADSDAALMLIEDARTAGVALAARVAADPSSAAADDRLTRLQARGIGVWLAVPAPADDEALDAWRDGLRRMLERNGSTIRILEVRIDQQPARLAAFAVQVAATEARARREDIRIAAGGHAMSDPVRRDAVYTPALAPYADLLSLDAETDAAAAWLERVDPGARIVAGAGAVPDSAAGPRAFVTRTLTDLGSPVVSRAWRPQDLPPAAIQSLRPLAELLTHEVSVLDPETVGLTLSVGAGDASGAVPHRLLFDTETFSTILAYWGEASADALDIAVHVPIEGTPGVVDLLTGVRSGARAYERDAAAERTRAAVPLTGDPMLVNFNEGATLLAEGTGVSAERTLTVGEIVSRHQQQQLAQDRLVRNYIADARMRQFFKPTITDPGYDIVTANRYFVAGDGIEWEELSFAVNNRRFENRPPLPMLQPEKVLSLPLQLRFDEGYRYELQGTERVDDIDCYKVQFEPVRDDPSLYRGTVWIDRRTFARIKVHAVQGDLPGMVISNDETLRYAPVATIDNRPIYLLSSLNGREIVLLAGRNILLEKNVTFGAFRVNGDGFADLRASARASDRIMFRETSNGLRNYVKRDGERVISDRVTEGVKAMALGTVVDSSYAFPLPIFGINYMDFSFGNPNTQLALLFGGVLAAGNIQRPQFGSKRLDASVDFFAIAAPSSDRLYTAAGEAEPERVLTWPMSTGFNLGWHATPFQKISAQYQFRFDAYVRDMTTSETFQIPSSTVTNGVGGAWEYSRAGYTATVNGAWYVRNRWEPWGDPASAAGLQSTPRSYSKFFASLSRDIDLDLFQKINLNAAWFGGRDLDRFVKYQFGIFDSTRIHGVPAAVRFGELAVARGSYSVNIFDQYRLDVFLDHAWGREDQHDAGWQYVPGIGAAFNLPAPWNTILRADVGHSWLPARYGSLGSTTLQIMLLKPLR